MKTNWLVRGVFLILALALGIFFGYRQILPPAAPSEIKEDVIGISEAGEGPDLNLLISHIKQMASQVHSVDSEGIRVTQAYLEQQLTEMGYAVQKESYQLTMDEVLALQKERADFRGAVFDETEAGNRDYSGIGDKPTMNLTNIIARVDAPDTDDTIIFVAHTDSVKMGPGAFDDIVSVSALLEGMRQVTRLTPARDLVFLFSDGEEQGLLGAAKFVKDHPELRDVTRLVINVEARGNKGAVLMFETTPDNLGIVSEYNNAVTYPVSFSIATAVYQTMQNDTDLSSFMMAGYPGMNLAVIDGAEVYHTAQDNVDTFDRASARHYLDTVTELVTHFATSPDLELSSGQDAVHFPFFAGNLWVMPQNTANLLAYAAFALTLFLLVLMLLRHKIAAGTLLYSFLLQLLCFAAAGGLSFLVIKLVLRSYSVSSCREILSLGFVQPLFYALLAGGALTSWVIFRVLVKGSKSTDSAALGVLILPAILALATTFLFPSANYLFSLPVLAGAAMFILSLALRPGAALFHALGSFVFMLLYVPVVILVYVALSFQSAHFAVVLSQIPLTMIWGLSALVHRKA